MCLKVFSASSMMSDISVDNNNLIILINIFKINNYFTHNTPHQFPIPFIPNIIIVNMTQQNIHQNNTCLDCKLQFQTPNQLQNHKRRFCVNSGYDNLQGLAKIQFNGVGPSHHPKIGHKNYLQHYGTNSLAKVREYDSLNATNLEKQLKNVNNFKRQLQGVQKYQHNQQYQASRLGTSKSSMLSESKNNYILEESQLDEQLKRYQKAPKEESMSPPTFIDQLNMRNHTILDKSNSSLGRMAVKDRIEYAKVKLDELNEIKDLYTKNGGTKAEFKMNIEKMIDFYNKFLKDNQERQKGDDNAITNSQELIQSRASTPILKLRELNEDEKPRRQKNKQSAVKQQKMNKSATNPNPNVYQPQFINPYGYGQPPIIMMPYPQPQSNSSIPSDSMRLLQKMVELKSEQNQRLLEIMLQEKRRPNLAQQPTIITLPQYSQSPNPQNNSLPLNSQAGQSKSMRRVKGMIDVQDDYQFKKSMIQDLISEEKILLSLQQEELDQIKLLSQLPKDLQQIKIKSIIKGSETRHKVEKEILKQKLDRMTYQEQNQNFEEGRKIGNDRWAGEQRKRLLQNQMKQYVNNFEAEFNSEPNIT